MTLAVDAACAARPLSLLPTLPRHLSLSFSLPFQFYVIGQFFLPIATLDSIFFSRFLPVRSSYPTSYRPVPLTVIPRPSITFFAIPWAFLPSLFATLPLAPERSCLSPWSSSSKSTPSLFLRHSRLGFCLLVPFYRGLSPEGPSARSPTSLCLFSPAAIGRLVSLRLCFHSYG